MDISRRSLIAGSTLLAGMLPFAAWAESGAAPLTPDQALARLKAGNDFFAMERLVHYDISSDRREELARGQYPFATLVSCSDSRAGPEQIFQVGLGDLFVVRAAGATNANGQSMGSIEYSVAVLNVPLIVVLGHSSCGASKEATNVVAHGATFPGQIGQAVAPLVPAARDTRNPGPPAGWTDRTTRENAIRIRNQLRTSPAILRPRVIDGRLKVEAAVYDLESGRVNFLPG
jgi:carbonic anhydrase